MSKFKPPIVPFVEARHQGGKQRPRSIVIRSSHTTSVEGAALGLASAWHRNTSSSQSCHYVVDESHVYQCTPDKIESEQGPGRGAIHICLCSEPLTSVEHWDDKHRAAVLDRAVDLVAQLCLAYRIPPNYLDFSAERAWDHREWIRPKGLILRVQGKFPADQFLANVKTQSAFFKTSL